ncbi:MAG: hypothetical protein K2K29_00120, partial [Muribaculaceae bacterium]|nr:hypothetical protein [Muribaculaceae bacterium]
SYPSTLGMELVADALLYGKSSFTPRYEPRVPALIFDNYDVATSNYGNLRLSPYYYWNNGSIGLRAGVNLYLTFNADAAAPNGMVLSDGHYNLFHISPDVRFDYSAGRFAAYIHATGGQEAVTLASIADRNLYSMPYLQSTTPVFVPVDAKIGFRVNPVAGLKFEVAAGYRITRNVPFCGWDMPVMNAVYAPASYSLPVLPVAEGDIATYGLGAGRYNLSGLYVDLNVGYKIGKALDLHAAMQYTPQNVGHGIFNGADRPRWILTPGVEVKPTDALTIGVDYEYRGVRSVWSGMARSIASRAEGNGGGTSVGPGSSSISEATTKSNSDAVGMRLPDIARLNAHAVYRFGDFGGVRNFSLGVEADNLLNHNDILLPGLPSEGLSISGIIRMEF